MSEKKMYKKVIVVWSEATLDGLTLGEMEDKQHRGWARAISTPSVAMTLEEARESEGWDEGNEEFFALPEPEDPPEADPIKPKKVDKPKKLTTYTVAAEIGQWVYGEVEASCAKEALSMVNEETAIGWEGDGSDPHLIPGSPHVISIGEDELKVERKKDERWIKSSFKDDPDFGKRRTFNVMMTAETCKESEIVARSAREALYKAEHDLDPNAAWYEVDGGDEPIRYEIAEGGDDEG